MTSPSWKWERHFQTMVGAILIALILWAGNRIQDQTVQVAVLSSQISNLTSSMKENEIRINQRLSALEARVFK